MDRHRRGGRTKGIRPEGWVVDGGEKGREEGTSLVDLAVMDQLGVDVRVLQRPVPREVVVDMRPLGFERGIFLQLRLYRKHTCISLPVGLARRGDDLKRGRDGRGGQGREDAPFDERCLERAFVCVCV